jgi:hypothetical protein
MRFGGLAWLAYRGHCPQGCAHTEGALSGCKEQWGQRGLNSIEFEAKRTVFGSAHH